jgi:hypothetical protein
MVAGGCGDEGLLIERFGPFRLMFCQSALNSFQ